VKSRVQSLVLAAGLLSAVSPSSYAHHAMSLFDQQKVTTASGTVAEFNWANPHATLYLDAKDSQGNTERWTIEFGPPAQLKRDNGMSTDSFKPGEKVTIEGHPYKDGRKIMRPTKVVLANGKLVEGLY